MSELVAVITINHLFAVVMMIIHINDVVEGCVIVEHLVQG
jgi:hypothetical protein